MWNERAIALAVRAVIVTLQRTGPQPREAVLRLLVQNGVPADFVVDIFGAGLSWALFEEDEGRIRANQGFGEPRPVSVAPPA